MLARITKHVIARVKVMARVEFTRLFCRIAWTPIILEYTGPIMTKFSELVDFRVEIIDLTFVSRSSRDVAMVANFWAKISSINPSKSTLHCK